MAWKKALVRGSGVLGGWETAPGTASPPTTCTSTCQGLGTPWRAAWPGGPPRKLDESPAENTSWMLQRAAQALRVGQASFPHPPIPPTPPPHQPAWLLLGHIGSQAALSVGLTTGAGAGLRTQSPLGSNTRGIYRDPSEGV